MKSPSDGPGIMHRAYTGAPWEKRNGYCRAIRIGPLVVTSGTTAVTESGEVLCRGDAHGQTLACYEIIERALRELGATRKSIVRARMFIVDFTHADRHAAAHREFFDDHEPCLTMVAVSALVDPAMLVEVEVDAWVSD